jgi:hypothetical protein
VLFVLASAGSALLAVPLPCNPTLVGATNLVQWTLFGPTACPLQSPLVWSSVLSVTIGV